MSGFTPFAGRKGFRATPLGRAINAPQPEVAEEPEAPPRPGVDIEALVAEAQPQGVAEARAELEPRLRELEEVLESLGPALDQLSALRKTALAEAAGDVGRMVTAICKRVIDEAFAIEPDRVVEVVQRAVAELPDSEDIRIEVPPGQVEHVMRHLDQRYQSAVVPEERIVAGCVVRTRHVSIDASLEAAMAGLEAALAEWQNQEPWDDEGGWR
ncbi:MAG: hypothetical protein KC656_00290 [Myxococcales bacterium]|nr:hypothetical protein [Myxococcales bacterium]